MTTVVLKSIKAIDDPPRQIKEWGERLVASYLLQVDLEDESFEFIWVVAMNESQPPCTEYDNDFDDFLVKICKGESFQKCKNFINEIQKKFSLAVHYLYTGDKTIEIQLPIEVIQ